MKRSMNQRSAELKRELRHKIMIILQHASSIRP